MIKKFGFTLAEVLITLGIIGVVAAMTIPTLMQRTNDAEIKSSYKKMISVLNQAISMNYALDGVDFSDISGVGAAGDTQGTSWLGFLYNRLNVVGSDANNNKIYFADGTSIQLADVDKKCGDTLSDSACKVVIDVNGKKAPDNFGTSGDLKDKYTLYAYRRQIGPTSAETDAGNYILNN